MGEVDLGFITLPGDFKSNFCPIPLASIFNKIKGGIQNKPNDFIARNEFCYFLFALMDIFVTIGKLITEFVGLK